MTLFETPNTVAVNSGGVIGGSDDGGVGDVGGGGDSGGGGGVGGGNNFMCEK